MCIGDWRLGRLVRSHGREIVIPNGSTISIKPDQTRVGLLLSAPVAEIALGGSCDIMVAGVSVGTLQSIFASLYFSMALHGDLLTKQFDLTAVGADEDVGITEWTMPEEYLTAALESFQSEYSQWLKQH
jgi:hypothetical protein